MAKIKPLSEIQAKEAKEIERSYNYGRLIESRDAHLSAMPILTANIKKHEAVIATLTSLLEGVEQLPEGVQGQIENSSGYSARSPRSHVHDARQLARVLFGTSKARAEADLKRATDQLVLAQQNVVNLESGIRELEAEVA